MRESAPEEFSRRRYSRRARIWASVVYGLMILGAIGLFLLIRSQGESLVAPLPETPSQGSGAATSPSDWS